MSLNLERTGICDNQWGMISQVKKAGGSNWLR